MNDQIPSLESIMPAPVEVSAPSVFDPKNVLSFTINEARPKEGGAYDVAFDIIAKKFMYDHEIRTFTDRIRDSLNIDIATISQTLRKHRVEGHFDKDLAEKLYQIYELLWSVHEKFPK